MHARGLNGTRPTRPRTKAAKQAARNEATRSQIAARREFLRDAPEPSAEELQAARRELESV